MSQSVDSGLGFAPSVIKNLRYPFSNTERTIHTKTLQELTQADGILSQYLGPIHPIRKDLARIIDDLKGRLGIE